MDFFESQHTARRNTNLLLFLFALAVLSLVLLTNLLVFFLLNQVGVTVTTGSAGNQAGLNNYSWEIFAMVSGGVILLIVISSLTRLAMLSKGGSAVAELMDGSLLVSAQGDLKKQQLLNVVEEMAIASGTPVPPVYLINDAAINAFAAGYASSDAVIGITTGALNTLSREEMQGVIAHEFSHILNGDMRINIRLIGVLYGILMLALIGRMMLQPGVRRSRGKSTSAVMAIGLGLMLIGGLGQFFGNLIKAAVSRQREFLADASAVQFTRNPDGIAGALKRIGASTSGSVVEHPESAEISHTFFAQGVKFNLASMMATHPPLEERIARIDPQWDGQFPVVSADQTVSSHTSRTRDASGTSMGFAAAATTVINPEAVIASVGNPGAPDLAAAQAIITAIPNSLLEAAREPYSARAVIYLLLLHNDADIRASQLTHLKAQADFGVYGVVETLIKQAEPEPGMRLPLLEIALPSLHQLSYEQYKLFLANMDTLIRADGRIGLSEWVVEKMVRKHLCSVFEIARVPAGNRTLDSTAKACTTLLSLLAWCDRTSGVTPAAAFECGRSSLELDLTLLDKGELGFSRLNTALDEVAALDPLRKPKLLKACIRTITADQKVSVIESDLLRTIADTIDCPMPPISTESYQTA